MENSDFNVNIDESVYKCQTAKFKVREAKHFLEKLQTNEIQKDEDLTTFYLNAFVTSASSVIDYVKSGFIYVKIKDPRINWKEWRNKDTRNEIINKHSQSKAITTFLMLYNNEKNNLLNIPLVNYFVYKRNKIIHQRWDGIKSTLSTEHPDGRVDIHKLTLESSYRLGLLEKVKDYDLDICYKHISKEQQKQLFTRLACDHAIPILEEFVTSLEEFIKKFEGKNFFN